MKLTEIYDSVVAEGSSAFAEVIAVLERAGMRYVVIGGLAVNFVCRAGVHGRR